MTRQYRQRKSDRLITPGASRDELRCDMACAPLDQVAREMDLKWGIDRLPGLVPANVAERYGQVIADLHAALDAHDPAATQAAVETAIKGLRVMDAKATQAGHKPTDPDIWQIEIDGLVFGFMRDGADWPRAKAMHPQMVIFTLREAVVALRPQMFGLAADPPIARRTEPVTPLELQLNDTIPF